MPSHIGKVAGKTVPETVRSEKTGKIQVFTRVLGLNLFSGDVSQIPYLGPQKSVINTMNPRVFTISRRDERLRASFDNTDFLIMDGQYFVFAPLLMSGKWVSKISGSNVFYHLMGEANKQSGKVFFLGASERVLELMKLRAKKEYPNLEVDYYSPPFKPQFSVDDNQRMIEKINVFKPDILFLGMTAPKQEIWGYENKEHLNTRIICAVGAVFDWYAGVQKQPERIWVRLGLEWFIRTVRRPEILNRYPDYLYFFWLLFLNFIRVRRD